MYLGNQWGANLSVTGADGLPPIEAAGNVVRSSTSVRLSMRLPPAMDAHKANEIMEKILTTDVPYNAKVTLSSGHAGNGWCKPAAYVDWLENSLQEAGKMYYCKPTSSYGMGGSIPFLSELGKKFPNTEIVTLGLCGPNSNIHGPNEM